MIVTDWTVYLIISRLEQNQVFCICYVQLLIIMWKHLYHVQAWSITVICWAEPDTSVWHLICWDQFSYYKRKSKQQTHSYTLLLLLFEAAPLPLSPLQVQVWFYTSVLISSGVSEGCLSVIQVRRSGLSLRATAGGKLGHFQFCVWACLHFLL